MRDRLMALDEWESPIEVSIIGCGRFGSMMVAQIARAPGMRVAVACDLSADRAREALARGDGEVGVVAADSASLRRTTRSSSACLS